MANNVTAIHFTPAYKNIKAYVHGLLDPANVSSLMNRSVNGFLIALILLNTLAVILETEKSLEHTYATAFHIFDRFSVVVFSIEYILRVWSCTCQEKYRHPVTGRLRYMVSTNAIIDLVAIIPFYLPLLFALDLRYLRLLRMLEFARFLKLHRYMVASRVIKNVLVAKKEELAIAFFATISLVLISSCLLYYAEHHVQPEKFSSIPATMWFSVVTLTTVGYGDITPVTTIGKFIASGIALLGIAMFAIPAGILASGFADEFRKLKKHHIHCPHCGEEIDFNGPNKHVHY